MSEILPALLSDQPVSLAAWFAEPLEAREAQAWLQRIRRQLGTRTEGSRFRLQLAGLIARYWAGEDIDTEFGTLLATSSAAAERAMLQLCYGQLLLSRKRQGGWGYLDAGFELAAPLLEADEYFQVLRRHELLRRLPLTAVPSEPQGLQALLTEAAVIGRLQGRGTRPHFAGRKHRDTVD